MKEKGVIWGKWTRVAEILALVPALTGEHFGRKAMGTIYGLVMFFGTMGSAIGPLISGYIFDLTGSYYFAFMLIGVLMIGGALCWIPGKETQVGTSPLMPACLCTIAENG